MARLLATNNTPAEGGVYLLDTDGGDVKLVSNASCRGITHGPDGYYTVENHGAVHHLDPRTWKSTQRATLPYDWCHDLKWYDDHFFLVASKGNRIVKLDPELRVVDEWQIVEDDDDVCHVNCLERVNGQFLLSIFTLEPGRREEKHGTHAWRHDGKVLRLDWERKAYEVLFEPLSQPHSLTWRDGLLYCCESYTSKVTVISPEEKRRTRLRRLNGFVRGLAFDGDRAFVGITKRRLEAYPPLLRWWGRMTRWCGVLEMDAKTWKPLRKHPLPGRQVYEILLVS